MKIKAPIKQDSDGAAPIWHDADGQYISYEDITEILNEYAKLQTDAAHSGESK